MFFLHILASCTWSDQTQIHHGARAFLHLHNLLWLSIFNKTKFTLWVGTKHPWLLGLSTWTDNLISGAQYFTLIPPNSTAKKYFSLEITKFYLSTLTIQIKQDIYSCSTLQPNQFKPTRLKYLPTSIKTPTFLIKESLLSCSALALCKQNCSRTLLKSRLIS